MQSNLLVKPNFFHAALSYRVPLWILHGILLTGTLVLFWPALRWAALHFNIVEHRFQLLALAVLSAVLLYRWQTRERMPIRLQSQLAPWPLIVYLLSGITYLANERFTGIHVFSAALAVVALYSLWGFYCRPTTWRQSALSALLLILLLPFGDYLDVYFGFPLRLLSAQIAGDLLSVAGYAAVHSDTLIAFENQVANVDLSCSGIKGVWAGLTFFVLLSWIEHKAITWRWWWRLALFGLLIVCMNSLRIMLLVLLDLGFQQHTLAALMHSALGVLGFALACLMGWLLLISAPTATSAGDTAKPRLVEHDPPAQSNVRQFALALIPLLFYLVYTPLPRETNTVNPVFTPQLPRDWQAQTMILSPQEARFFPRNAAAAKKYRFQHSEALQGTVIFVRSNYWKAHHDPKNCLTAQGYHITGETSVRLDASHTVHKLDIVRDDTTAAAFYWFQSATQFTDDFSARLFSGILDRKQSWVMVSVILDDSTPSANELQTLVHTFADANRSPLTRAF